MARPIAVRAEIVGRLHQARAEMTLPEAIDDDPRASADAADRQPAGEFACAVDWHVGGEFRLIVRRPGCSAAADRRGSTCSPTRRAAAREWACASTCRSRSRESSRACGGSESSSASNSACIFTRSSPVFVRSTSFSSSISPLIRFVSASQACLLRGRGERDVVLLRRGEVGLQAVVVLLRNRLQLVVVAAGTADREPEKRGADDVGPLGQHFVATERDLRIARVAPDGAEAMKDRRGQARRDPAEPISSPAICSATN